MNQPWPQNKIIQHKDNTDIAFFVLEAEQISDKEYFLVGSWIKLCSNNKYIKIDNDEFYVDVNTLKEKYIELPEPDLNGSTVKVYINSNRFEGKVLKQNEDGYLSVYISPVEDDYKVHWIFTIPTEVNL